MAKLTKREARALVKAYGMRKADVAERCAPGCPGWWRDEERNQVHRCDECEAFDGDLAASAYVLDRLLVEPKVRAMVEAMYRRERRETLRA